MIRRDAGPAFEGTASQIADRLIRADAEAGEFLQSLLEMQCHLGPAEGGAALRLDQQGGLALIAVFPAVDASAKTPRWIETAAEDARKAVAEGRAIVRSMPGRDTYYADEPREHLISIPLEGAEGSSAAAIFLVLARTNAELSERQERLALTPSFLGLFELKSALKQAHASGERAASAMQLAAATAQHEKFKATAMALCDAASSRLRCDRVSVGFLKGRVIAIAAMSHTEKINRKMELVQRLESVMEECFDQDIEVVWPSPPEAPAITRAAAEFDRKHGPISIVSVPLRNAGEPVGVLTLERTAEEPFTPAEIESLRVACDLVTPRLEELRDHDRWLGARVARETRSWFAVLLGPEKVWIKLAALIVLATILFLVFVKGMYKVESTFALQATERHVVPAPFNGYLAEVNVDVGDPVAAEETLLARLDTAELRLQLAQSRAEQARFVKEASIARRDGEIARAQIAEASAAEAGARIDLLTHQIEQAAIHSRIDGVVVGGELKRLLGAPVQTGNVLFEIAPIEALRADLLVPEDQISE
ncbi:MAG: GAF domain-containing protein, partial [Planctomycetota bacterium]|nr:GAF domain-containing protein [Planctomycetota bacterium]